MCGFMNGEESRSKLLTRINLVFVCLICSRILSGQVTGNMSNDKAGNIISHWSFDSDQPGYVHDNARNINDSLYGNFEYVKGIKGKGLKLDGFRTFAKRNSPIFKKIPDSS